jgi:hypothetical protein
MKYIFTFLSQFPSRLFVFLNKYWGHAVAQLVEALRYKPEGRGFDSRWCHWNFSLTQSFRSHYRPGIDSVSNRNEYQEYPLGGKGGRCVELTLPPSCNDCLVIWEPQRPGNLGACPGIALPSINFIQMVRSKRMGCSIGTGQWKCIHGRGGEP